MSPAKATRPGFRHSLASADDPCLTDQNAINLFHPIYHGFTFPIGCRIDIERILPANLDEADTEELVDVFSEPPVWMERLSPLAVQIGDQVIRGRNAPDLMLKVYRMMFDLFGGIGRFIESTVAQNTGEGVRFPFMSLCVDPDTLHRIIESDYESGETAYANLMKLFAQGTVAPCLTTPFHAILPHLTTDVEVRLCVRSSLLFYLRVLRNYRDFLKRNGEEDLMVVPFWLPECGFSQRVLTILSEEFAAVCKKEKLGTGHLLIMLDNHQAVFTENDVLMKSWNQVPVRGAVEKTGRSRDKKIAGVHEGVSNVSVMFRDRSFSDWVIHASPSVKKLLDRTIAKVDSDINQQNVHYGWAHFEELEAISYTPRAIVNFQQKLVKLTELGYLPLSPDFYVRGKLRGEFGCTEQEPRDITLIDNSIGNGWNLEKSQDASRWAGCRPCEQTGNTIPVARPYQRPAEDGSKIQEPGDPSWKIAWNRTRDAVYKEIVGNLETLEGGMAEVLAGLTGLSAPEKQQRNVEDFLSHYTYVYWREHFIQHDLAEADINIHELTGKYLQAGIKGEASESEAAIAGAAAQAIYFCLDSGRSVGTAFENMDQRAFYQNVAMLTLALCNATYVYHWLEDEKGAKRMLDLLKTELLDFESAYTRYGMEELGVSKARWKQTLRSEVEDCKDNVVRRAALRVAARHLRPLGYTKDFTRQHANLSTNVGHIWSLETCRENFCYENSKFCGVSEE